MKHHLLQRQSVIAMIHVDALPGTPRHTRSMDEIIERACTEAAVYKEAGVPILMIENMHDRPYLKEQVGPEITAAMAVIGRAVKDASGLPCGIQILGGANKEALAAAHAAGLDFVRAESFVFAHVGDEGILQSSAGELLRYRRAIGAERVQVFTDLKKKHSSHAITADLDIAEEARAAEFFLADGVIVTGAATACPACVEEVSAVKQAVTLPVLIGSGITADNLRDYIACADGFIVGSHFKDDGVWSNAINRERLCRFMEVFIALAKRSAK